MPPLRVHESRGDERQSTQTDLEEGLGRGLGRPAQHDHLLVGKRSPLGPWHVKHHPVRVDRRLDADDGEKRVHLVLPESACNVTLHRERKRDDSQRVVPSRISRRYLHDSQRYVGCRVDGDDRGHCHDLDASRREERFPAERLAPRPTVSVFCTTTLLSLGSSPSLPHAWCDLPGRREPRSLGRRTPFPLHRRATVEEEHAEDGGASFFTEVLRVCTAGLSLSGSSLLLLHIRVGNGPGCGLPPYAAQAVDDRGHCLVLCCHLFLWYSCVDGKMEDILYSRGRRYSRR